MGIMDLTLTLSNPSYKVSVSSIQEETKTKGVSTVPFPLWTHLILAHTLKQKPYLTY